MFTTIWYLCARDDLAPCLEEHFRDLSVNFGSQVGHLAEKYAATIFGLRGKDSDVGRGGDDLRRSLVGRSPLGGGETGDATHKREKGPKRNFRDNKHHASKSYGAKSVPWWPGSPYVSSVVTVGHAGLDQRFMPTRAARLASPRPGARSCLRPDAIRLQDRCRRSSRGSRRLRPPERSANYESGGRPASRS